MAYYLMEQGLNTVLVEKRSEIGVGSTCANSGLLQFTSDKSLTSCIHSMGEGQGVRFYRMCLEAVHTLESISSKLVFSSDLIRRNSLYYASIQEDLPMLQEDYEAMKRYGFPVEYWDSSHIAEHYSFTKPGAIYSSGDAEVNPYKLVHALVQTSYHRGLRVYTNTEITGHAFEDGQLTLRAGRNRIRAQYAVYATGYETQELKRNPNAVLSSTYAIATQPIPDLGGWYKRSLIWETARPYLYLRTTADNRIIIGGMDDNTAIAEERERSLPRKKELLLEEARKLFPDIPGLSAQYGWTGVFCSTHDGLPMIGIQEEYPNSFFMLGYGGNGTVYSVIAARIICECISSGSSPDAELFRFDRPTRSLESQ
ncbi:MAG: amino acid oxidase, partial [Paenibacillus sp.]|jgi:glycine/D-amino acid oxidase-like deaminating enzyme|nr:amino acid oxidase [Paenibacillus sp.]